MRRDAPGPRARCVPAVRGGTRTWNDRSAASSPPGPWSGGGGLGTLLGPEETPLPPAGGGVWSCRWFPSRAGASNAGARAVPRALVRGGGAGVGGGGRGRPGWGGVLSVA
ncbi:hypothetical protein PA7_47700 [Pseudonocardia asaccharolytica DSM 44247 = NBRC 16224]|uniref:Uncharacterized protein n=1 Tax=Pseudonocardia asaccharolytica DSM 44247 = NBRC 16224 TaxID=1123024 RepID=A0A511D959_9PSEU|nr:hypothetical protein PA7_47700 [Pseudonocardia asaccharolytica DSM 44247 = NBRC 16224]